jgi:hypothetical protein
MSDNFVRKVNSYTVGDIRQALGVDRFHVSSDGSVIETDEHGNDTGKQVPAIEVIARVESAKHERAR